MSLLPGSADRHEHYRRAGQKPPSKSPPQRARQRRLHRQPIDHRG